MSKKTSPQSRPGRRPRRMRAGGTTAGRAATPRPAPEQQAPTGLRGRLRRYLPVVLVPNGVVVLVLIVFALAGLLFTGTSLAALPATIAQLWLILNLVPVSAGGIVLGVLPLLPAMGLAALIARRVHVAVRDRVSMADLLVLALSAVVVPLVLTFIATGMMWDAGRVFDVGPPPVGQAVARTLLVHLLALATGMGGRLWRALLRRYNAPEWLVDATATAVRILLLLSAAALVVMLVLLFTGWSRQTELAAIYAGGPGMVGSSLISLLYLPNAVIAVITVLLGSEFHLGAASISLYAIDLTALPPLPLLALIPAWAHPWSITLLLVTSIAVAYVLSNVRFNIRQTLATSAVTAVLVLIFSYLTWGEIGHLGTGGPMIWLTAGLALAWTAGIGVAAALLGRLADRRAAKPAKPAAAPETEPDPEPEPEETIEEVIDSEIVEDEEVEAEEEPTEEEVAEGEATEGEAAEELMQEPEEETAGESEETAESQEDNGKAEDPERRD
ncbi:DUF6350 family protein [Corynebacterium sp. YIM 101645]|uniref:DUF6350 family protein n=1 Tax=Corynebacterium lemuris TaxID=1859292 RepID=A0ABT2G152_9CORY|nr:DUF6350 family protein [Corynebacterium lemuris]MCS5480438.1 DUF6350 family protein [Corynebacterium lemuris]